MDTLWAEMGAVLTRDDAESIKAQLGQKWAHFIYVGTLWAEMDAVLTRDDAESIRAQLGQKWAH